MSKEASFGQDAKRIQNLKQVRSFKDLVAFLESVGLDDETYRKAYDEVAVFAKRLVADRQKDFWNAHHKGFLEELREKYPSLSFHYLEALMRCLENYNPPVNIPNTHLWDID